MPDKVLLETAEIIIQDLRNVADVGALHVFPTGNEDLMDLQNVTNDDIESIQKNNQMVISEVVNELIENDFCSEYVPDCENSDTENNKQSMGNENQEQDKKDNYSNKQIQENNVENNINIGNVMEGRKRNIRREPNEWTKNQTKKLRMEGKEYIGYSRSKNTGKVKHNVPRNARKLGPTCKSSECIRVKSRRCNEITEEQRKELFEKFWTIMNWDQRKVFVINHIKRYSPKRVYTNKDESRRNYSLQYFLTVNCNKMQVCKKMFLHTLSIGEYSVHSWIKKGIHCGRTNSSEVDNKTNKHSSSSRDKENGKLYLKEFLDSLPKLPSHYGRSNSSKLYLETTIRSLNQLYNLYKEKCTDENKSPLSRTVFNQSFYSINLSIHPIKKDKCDMCTQHEVGQLSDEMWNTHIHKKDRAREEKKKDIEYVKSSGQGRILTIDLEAVKCCPYVQASAIFFKLKLCCHNFTIYDVVTHKAKCFWFTEIDADMTASTFASCLIDYLSTDCQNESGPITIFSDGCTYQNRNVILANALLDYSVKNNIEIVQKFLEVGHTQMECDSVHSCIERKLKGHDIYLPSDYLRITKEARSKPFPYEVRTMQYSDFKDYTIKKYQRYGSIRPGKVE